MILHNEVSDGYLPNPSTSNPRPHPPKKQTNIMNLKSVYKETKPPHILYLVDSKFSELVKILAVHPVTPCCEQSDFEVGGSAAYASSCENSKKKKLVLCS